MNDAQLARNVEESGQSYVNALVSYHRAVKSLEEAQHRVAIERGLVEAAFERNEAWLRRRARVGTLSPAQLADLDPHDKQAREAAEQ